MCRRRNVACPPTPVSTRVSSSKPTRPVEPDEPVTESGEELFRWRETAASRWLATPRESGWCKPERTIPAPVAQLDRVLASEAKGHRFESCRARQFPPPRFLASRHTAPSPEPRAMVARFRLPFPDRRRCRPVREIGQGPLRDSDFRIPGWAGPGMKGVKGARREVRHARGVSSARSGSKGSQGSEGRLRTVSSGVSAVRARDP